uniref:Uncharacterized protein n=1 Tax=Salix viminalis TaxID=40686 RepID=A0A6N2MZQ4_SALVM
MEEKPFPAWIWSVEQCLKELNVKLDKGLSYYEVESGERYGGMSCKKASPCGAYYMRRVCGAGFEAYVEPLVIV